jgi:large subunit ribosomal protein L18
MENRALRRAKIHRRIRKIVSGTAERPRLSVYRSLNHMYAQLIDDTAGKTLAAISSMGASGPLRAKAEQVGQEIAAAAKAKKITQAVFDRGGFAYQGAIKIVCESARQNGLTI